MMADDFHLPQNCTGQKTRQTRLRSKGRRDKTQSLGDISKEAPLDSQSDLKPYTFYHRPLNWRHLNRDLPEMVVYEIISMTFLDVYSPVSARASIGKKDGALFEKRQVAEAGNSSSAK